MVLRLTEDLHIHALVGEKNHGHELGTPAVHKAGYKADAAILGELSSQPELLTISHTSTRKFNLEIQVKCNGTHAGGNRGVVTWAGGEDASAVANAIEKLNKVISSRQELEQE